MLHNGYWLTQYLSVSSILRKAPATYALSYLHTETDNCDATYFVLYQLEVIERAIESLHAYLARKMAEGREIQALLHGSAFLNYRQLGILQEALRNPGNSFTIAEEAMRYRVANQSARTDLLSLVDRDLFTKVRVGKKFVFRSMPDLVDRLRRLGETAR
jgi:Fic family protein